MKKVNIGSVNPLKFQILATQFVILGEKLFLFIYANNSVATDIPAEDPPL